VNAELVTELEQPLQRTTSRARIVSALGPTAAFAGVLWAIVQPYRVTLLHPRGQGFWWLFVEPPLLVIAVGLFFHFVIAPGLLRDLEEEDTVTRPAPFGSAWPALTRRAAPSSVAPGQTSPSTPSVLAALGARDPDILQRDPKDHPHATAQ
jgi:ABC-type amino acid transport system permease subunit